MNELLLNGFIAAIGLLLHFSMKWAEARQSSTTPPSAVGYIRSVPAQSLIALLSTVGVFAVAFTMEWLNPLTALASGYMGHSMAENLMNKVKATPL